MSDLVIEPLDWAGVSEPTVQEIVRLGELQLSDLFQAALAADQRAVNQAGILAGFGAALLAAAGTLWLSDTSRIMAVSALIAGGGMVASAFISGLAARPSDYYANGYEPKRIMPSARDNAWMLKCVAEDLQARIRANRKSLDDTARLTTIATNGAFLAIVVAGLALALMLTAL
jgi:hypothetical protein